MSDTDTTTPEVWKPVPALEEVYEVSSLGRVRRIGAGRNVSAGHIMTPQTMKTGYQQVRLYKGKSNPYYVHRLVASAFFGPPPLGRLTEVNHINGVKADNRVENLEYVSRDENIAHSVKRGLIAFGTRSRNAKLDDDKVRQAFKMKAEGHTQYHIASVLGVSQPTVSEVLSRKLWRRVK